MIKRSEIEVLLMHRYVDEYSSYEAAFDKCAFCYNGNDRNKCIFCPLLFVFLTCEIIFLLFLVIRYAFNVIFFSFGQFQIGISSPDSDNRVSFQLWHLTCKYKIQDKYFYKIYLCIKFWKLL